MDLRLHGFPRGVPDAQCEVAGRSLPVSLVARIIIRGDSGHFVGSLEYCYEDHD
jgi:hypothetical protein